MISHCSRPYVVYRSGAQLDCKLVKTVDTVTSWPQVSKLGMSVVYCSPSLVRTRDGRAPVASRSSVITSRSGVGRGRSQVYNDGRALVGVLRSSFTPIDIRLTFKDCHPRMLVTPRCTTRGCAPRCDRIVGLGRNDRGHSPSVSKTVSVRSPLSQK